MSGAPLPSPEAKHEFVRDMFTGIARRYDLLNSLLSLRLDRRWRRFAAQVADVEDGSLVLDVCCGTGDFAFALGEQADGVTVVASDFVAEMLHLGRQKSERRGNDRRFIPLLADTLALPFPNNVFDVVSVGFGIRNVADVKGGIAEMTRVARPGGRIVILEFTQPRRSFLRRLYMFYFTRILPRIGNAISKSNLDAYSYLPASVLEFPTADALASLMRECGLTNVRYDLRTFGVVAVHVGQKRKAQ